MKVVLEIIGHTCASVTIVNSKEGQLRVALEVGEGGAPVLVSVVTNSQNIPNTKYIRFLRNVRILNTDYIWFLKKTPCIWIVPIGIIRDNTVPGWTSCSPSCWTPRPSAGSWRSCASAWGWRTHSVPTLLRSSSSWRSSGACATWTHRIQPETIWWEGDEECKGILLLLTKVFFILNFYEVLSCNHSFIYYWKVHSIYWLERAYF